MRMSIVLARGYALLTFAMPLGGCDHRIPLGSLVGGDADGGDDGSTRDAGADDDAGAEDGGADAGSENLCERKGPIVEVGDSSGNGCAGGVATRAFRYGICTCDSFQNSAATVVDAFDSRQGPFTSGENGGSMATNGSASPRDLTVTGDLIIAGPNGTSLMADIEVAGDVSVQGQLDGPSFGAEIGGDARVGGTLHLANLTVGGDLTVSEESDVAISAGNPAFTRADIAVAAPCDCAPELDLRSLITAASQTNDNRAIDLDPADGLRSLNGPIERTLPCGTYYVDAFYAPQSITLTITGHVALFVNSTIVAEQQGDIRFLLIPGAELDLFVANGITTTRRFELGNAESAGRVRLYADKGSSFNFKGETSIAGSVHGPRASLNVEGPFTVFGAVDVERITSSAQLTVHYDRALGDETCRL